MGKHGCMHAELERKSEVQSLFDAEMLFDWCSRGNKVTPMSEQNVPSLVSWLVHSSELSCISAVKIVSAVEEMWGIQGDCGL